MFSLPFSEELAPALEKPQLSDSKTYLRIYLVENPRGGGGRGVEALPYWGYRKRHA